MPGRGGKRREREEEGKEEREGREKSKNTSPSIPAYAPDQRSREVRALQHTYRQIRMKTYRVKGRFNSKKFSLKVVNILAQEDQQTNFL